MKLTDAATGSDVIPLFVLSADKELARETQGRLMLAGLLDPPIDGKFGPVSTWALKAFCDMSKLPFPQGLSPVAAARLLDARVEAALASDDLAGRVVAAMERRGYWLARHPQCWNIIYVEGANPDGTANGNEPNRFNDVRLLLRFKDGKQPVVDHAWKATTEPGRYWTEHPMNPNGAARIAFGQYKAWNIGIHHAGKASAHEALVQVADVSVYRDKNRDYSRTGDALDPGIFGINQHWGYDMPEDDLRTSSAGCLVGRKKDEHLEFLKLVKQDPRHLAGSGYRFMTAILPAAALSEKSFNPAQPH